MIDCDRFNIFGLYCNSLPHNSIGTSITEKGRHSRMPLSGMTTLLHCPLAIAIRFFTSEVFPVLPGQGSDPSAKGPRHLGRYLLVCKHRGDCIGEIILFDG